MGEGNKERKVESEVDAGVMRGVVVEGHLNIYMGVNGWCL